MRIGFFLQEFNVLLFVLASKKATYKGGGVETESFWGHMNVGYYHGCLNFIIYGFTQ